MPIGQIGRPVAHTLMYWLAERRLIADLERLR